jgi:hypothetical protein
MAVLTNRGRLISSLAEYDINTYSSADLLVIQDISANVTEKISLSNLSNILLSAGGGSTINFTDPANRFTGSFFVPTAATLKTIGTANLGVRQSGVAMVLIQSYNGTAGSDDITINCNDFGITSDSVIISGPTTITDQLEVDSNLIVYGNVSVPLGSVAAVSFSGKLTGPVTGSIRGDVYSNTGVKVLENGSGGVATAFFYGTSSHASNVTSASHALIADTTITCISSITSASYALSSSYTDIAELSNTSSYLDYTIGVNNGTASYAVIAASALTLINPPTSAVSSSYAINSSTTDEVAGDTTGTGVGSFNIAFFSQSKVASNNGFFRITNGAGLGNYQQLIISSSRYNNGLVVVSRGYSNNNQAYSAYYNLNNTKNLSNYPNVSGYTVGSFGSGSLTFVAPLGSAEFSSSTRVAVGSATETYAFVSRRSGYYFWPYMSTNTPSRDGSIGIGVQPPGSADTDSALLGKFHVRCFSSSKAHVGKVTGQALTGTVKLPEYAIYVDYGSSSYSPIFSVGASGSNAGDVYVDGDMTVAGTLNATLGYGTQTANAFAVRYPLGAITYGDYIFYCQANFTNRGYFFRLNQVTNEVTKIFDGNNTFSPARQFYAGHMALHNFNNNGVTADYIVVADSSYIYAIGDLTSGTPTITEFSTGGGNFYQFKCVYVDASDSAHPTFYLLPDSYQAGGNTANALTMYKVYWNGSAYTYAIVGTALDILNNSLVLGNSNLVSINGTVNYNTITNIYNPVKRRWYCINNNSGMCDIFNINAYSSNDIGAWWAQAAGTRDPQLQYVKTIVIPQQGSNYWTDSNWESYGLEYDTTTGQEKFWTWNRVNNSSLTGIVGKSPWYGS